MKISLLSAFLVSFLSILPGQSAVAEDEAEEPPGRAVSVLPAQALPAVSEPLPAPSARQLLRNVVARFPREPLTIQGRFLVRKRRGVEIGKRRFKMSVHWGGDPAVAEYSIMDGSGKILEQLQISRRRGGETQFGYLKGDPPKSATTPSLFAPIQGTDISWMDLTLSFLWWPGGTVVGKDRIRGHSCHVLDIPAPALAGKDSDKTTYAKVRLWVEEKLHVLLQAEGQDAKGKPVRRLWVKSCKKINGRWMIKDMEIQSYPAVHRTKLSIQEVNLVEQP